jgi:glycosyltransferase involved in cell wall biosynthesis
VSSGSSTAGVRRPTVVLARGHQASSWQLRPWALLRDRYEVIYLRTRRNWFDTELIEIEQRPALTLSDLLLPGPVGHLLSRSPGDRYLRPMKCFRGADIVHSHDLAFWYSMQAAKHKHRFGYKLVLTVAESLPFLSTYRNIGSRPHRKLVLEHTDLFLAITERARAALLLEGAPDDRIRICPRGVDRELFARAAEAAERTDRHLILSTGRLVWEKGHQDVLRAVAALRHGAVAGLSGAEPPPKVLVIGSGPEERRLRRYASDLGIADDVEIRHTVPYSEMPDIYARSSCLVLGSLPTRSWEEQFGFVLLEAASSGLPVLATTTGAIPEVLGGQATLFAPGDWIGLAEALARGPLSQPPAARVSYSPEFLERYSNAATAECLAAAYEEVLAP